jgi:iron complex transport system ATP-binding protein
MSTLLSLRSVGARLDGRPVLENVTLGCAVGERVALVGPNGAGKSTLLRRIAGLTPGDGNLHIGGEDLARMSPAARARRIAFLPQQRQIAWPIPVRDLVMLGRMPHGIDPLRPRAEDRAAVAAVMARLGIADWALRPATSLSQGEQARVLLARALATEADILLADEPIAALDPRHQLDALAALAEEATRGALVIAVLHDLALASQWANRVILLHDGKVLADGPPQSVITPAHLAASFGVAMHRGETSEGPALLFSSLR